MRQKRRYLGPLFSSITTSFDVQCYYILCRLYNNYEIDITYILFFQRSPTHNYNLKWTFVELKLTSYATNDTVFNKLNNKIYAELYFLFISVYSDFVL